MAVYTEVSKTDLENLLKDFDLGRLVDFKGIDGGIENTNYFVTLNNSEGQNREYVLTLFEELNQDEMPYFVELTTWLAERGCPVPFPFKDNNGIALKSLHGRPALLQPRLPGHHIETLTERHCSQIGAALAQFHQAGRDFYLQRQAHRGVLWWRREAPHITGGAPDGSEHLRCTEGERCVQLRAYAWDAQ